MRIGGASRIIFTSFPFNYHNTHLINPPCFQIKPFTRLGFCNSRHLPIAAASPPPIMSPSPPVVEVKDRIDLNEKEIRIFDRLRDVLTHFQLDTQLRVAGGWVRDKVQLHTHTYIYDCRLFFTYLSCFIFTISFIVSLICLICL